MSRFLGTVVPQLLLTHCVLSCYHLGAVTCGLQWFEQKYRMLGDFENAWFGGRLPIAPSFHLDARDAVLRKQEANASAEQLYREQVLFGTDDSELRNVAARHLELGVLFRCSRHTQLIASRASSWDGDLYPARRANGRPDGCESQEASSSRGVSSPSQAPSNPAASAAATAEFNRAWIIAQVAQQYLVDR